MSNCIPWIVALVILLGHFGFWLTWLNRVNGLGIPRQIIKAISKGFIGIAIVLPLLIWWRESSAIQQWLLQSSSWWPNGGLLLNIWSAVSIATFVLMGPIWLESRRLLIPPKQLISSQSQFFDLAQEAGEELVIEPAYRPIARLPGNQVTKLDVSRKELWLPRLPTSLDGFTIGHISDLHITGKFSTKLYHLALDHLQQQQPDWIVITGDIIDYKKCLDWIEPLLGRLHAPLGCSFVLGNHDRRLRDTEPILERLERLGFFDLGRSDQWLEFQGGKIFVTGTEHPWFNRRQSPPLQPPTEVDESVLRVGLSHSPDQINYARRQKLDLMFAGHTHGGQVRIPGIGPLVAPSFYGSRFASGVFYFEPTLIHVSRGISGVHPFRWFCMPEVSLLTLRKTRLAA